MSPKTLTKPVREVSVLVYCEVNQFLGLIDRLTQRNKTYTHTYIHTHIHGNQRHICHDISISSKYMITKNVY